MVLQDDFAGIDLDFDTQVKFGTFQKNWRSNYKETGQSEHRDRERGKIQMK